MTTISDRWQVRIGDRRYVAELPLLDRQRIGSLLQATDASQEASDRSISNDGLWRRTRSNFEEGAGQEWVDLTEESVDANPLRFHWSRGVDVLSNPGSLSVLPDTSQVMALANATAGPDGWLLYHLDYVYGASGSSVKRSGLNDIDSAWTACTGEGGVTITDMVALGDTIYIANGAEVRSVASGGTAFSVFSTELTDRLVAGSGRLLGMHDNDIWEFTNAGAKRGSANIHSHFDTAFAWKGGVAAPNGVYVFGDSGSTSEMYLLAVTDVAGEFAAPYPVGQLEDETINKMVFYGGFIILATSKGIRLAQIGGSGFLTYGPVIEIGDVEDLYKAPEGFVYFTWSNFADVDGVQVDAGVGRLALDRFTQPLVPAYQSDVMSGTTNSVRCVSGLNGRVVFGYDDGASQLTVYAADASGVEATATFRPGKIVFGSAETKAFTEFEVKTSDLAGTVSVTLGADGTDYVLTGDETTRRRSFTSPDNIVAEEYDPVVTLSSFTGSLDRWSLFSIPMLRRAKAWTLPLKIARRVSDHGKVVDFRNPLDEIEYLDGLVDTGELVTVEVGSYTFQARVDDVYLSQNASQQLVGDWTSVDQDEFFDSTWLVRVIENAN